MKKNILFVEQYMKGFVKTWEEYGYHVYTLAEDLLKEVDKKNNAVIQREVLKNDISLVFSFDYKPGTAEVCHNLNIKYICWVWDCPHIHLWHKTARYETTYIFAFDYVQFEMQLNRGLPNVFYLPLSPDIDTFKQVIENDGKRSYEKYRCDVTFLGNIYNDDKHSLFDSIEHLPAYTEGYLDALIQAQRNIWGYSLFENGIDDFVWSELKQYLKLDIGDQYDDGIFKVWLIDIINKKVAQNDRKEMCSYLARNYNFNLFSGADTSFDPAINNKGYAIYDTQMPLIFNYSKINIHITVRSITSGIPLRVVDVLACGGFLLTNYQNEILEYFEDGVDLVVYQDFNDLYDKIDYYLAHEEERQQIAQNGQKKVETLFHYRNQVGQIISVVEE